MTISTASGIAVFDNCFCVISSSFPQYIPVSGAEPGSVPLPGLLEHRRLPAGPQQPAVPLAAVHPAGPRRRRRRLPQPKWGQQHRKPAGRNDAPRHRQLPGWVEARSLDRRMF